MDPITGALLAGATQLAVAETTKSVVKDAYEGLKAKVKQWFVERKRPDGEMALTMIEQKPDIWQGPLAEAVKDSGAADNEALLQAAQVLIQALQESTAFRSPAASRPRTLLSPPRGRACLAERAAVSRQGRGGVRAGQSVHQLEPVMYFGI